MGRRLIQATRHQDSAWRTRSLARATLKKGPAPGPGSTAISRLLRSRRIRTTALVALVVLLADLASKRLVQSRIDLGDRIDVVPDWFVFTHIHNTGAAYGLFAGQRWLLVATALVIAAMTPLLMKALPEGGRWGWAGPVLTGMILGGAIGNLSERAYQGYVTDFLQVPPIELFQVFNIADAAISVAVAALLVLSFVAGDPSPQTQERRVTSGDKDAAAGTANGEPLRPDADEGPVHEGEPPSRSTHSDGVAAPRALGDSPG